MAGHSVFSATLLLSITALFREPKAREDLQLDTWLDQKSGLTAIIGKWHL
jgi:hypothetical protein